MQNLKTMEEELEAVKEKVLETLVETSYYERNKFYSYTVYSYRNNFTVTEIILQLPKKFYSYW